MLHPATKVLFDRVYEMTMNKKIRWEEGDTGTVRFDTKGYIVVVGSEPPEVSIFTPAGKLVEQADASELSSTEHEDHGDYSGAVTALFIEAHRRARGADEAIETILHGLDLDGDGVPDVFFDADGEVVDADGEPVDLTEEEIEAAEDELAEADETDAEDPVGEPGYQGEEAEMAQAVKDMADELNTPVEDAAEEIADDVPLEDDYDDTSDAETTDDDSPATAVAGTGALGIAGETMFGGPYGKRTPVADEVSEEDEEDEAEEEAGFEASGTDEPSGETSPFRATTSTYPGFVPPAPEPSTGESDTEDADEEESVSEASDDAEDTDDSGEADEPAADTAGETAPAWGASYISGSADETSAVDTPKTDTDKTTSEQASPSWYTASDKADDADDTTGEEPASDTAPESSDDHWIEGGAVAAAVGGVAAALQSGRQEEVAPEAPEGFAESVSKDLPTAYEAPGEPDFTTAAEEVGSVVSTGTPEGKTPPSTSFDSDSASSDEYPFSFGSPAAAKAEPASGDAAPSEPAPEPEPYGFSSKATTGEDAPKESGTQGAAFFSSVGAATAKVADEVAETAEETVESALEAANEDTPDDDAEDDEAKETSTSGDGKPGGRFNPWM